MISLEISAFAAFVFATRSMSSSLPCLRAVILPSFHCARDSLSYLINTRAQISIWTPPSFSHFYICWRRNFLFRLLSRVRVESSETVAAVHIHVINWYLRSFAMQGYTVLIKGYDRYYGIGFIHVNLKSFELFLTAWQAMSVYCKCNLQCHSYFWCDVDSVNLVSTNDKGKQCCI